MKVITMATQKLELTWIGKNEQPKIEPRLLIHDQSKDYGDPDARMRSRFCIGRKNRRKSSTQKR